MVKPINDERIKSKKEIDLIFRKGQILFSSDKRIKAICLVNKSVKKIDVKTVFAVSKRAGNAVWRNRIKRLMRIAFHDNAGLLRHQTYQTNNSLDIVLSTFGLNKIKYPKPKLSMIMSSMNDLCKKLVLVLENE
ncbi:MAG: ribonuclease P protein component [Ignavibacteriales bacterium]|nr:ribonuclease P protein component [Ignavibacteriales bacterium]